VTAVAAKSRVSKKEEEKLPRQKLGKGKQSSAQSVYVTRPKTKVMEKGTYVTSYWGGRGSPYREKFREQEHRLVAPKKKKRNGDALETIPLKTSGPAGKERRPESSTDQR